MYYKAIPDYAVNQDVISVLYIVLYVFCSNKILQRRSKDDILLQYLGSVFKIDLYVVTMYYKATPVMQLIKMLLVSYTYRVVCVL